MRDLLEDLKTFFHFLSFDGIRTFCKEPVTGLKLFILWFAGTMRDIANIGKKNQDNCDE